LLEGILNKCSITLQADRWKADGLGWLHERYADWLRWTDWQWQVGNLTGWKRQAGWAALLGRQAGRHVGWLADCLRYTDFQMGRLADWLAEWGRSRQIGIR